MKRVNHSQNGESGVELISNQSQLRVHPINSSVGYVYAVQESEEQQQTEDGNDADVNLPDQRRLFDVWDISLAEAFPSLSRAGCPFAEGAGEPEADNAGSMNVIRA